VSVLGTAPIRHPGMPRNETRAVCAQCGKETTLPLRPTQGPPVLCRDCFRQKQTAASA
jgi:CxxC-x17-CxxC domain-containing protein